MIEDLTAVQAGLKTENGALKASNFTQKKEIETLNNKFTGLESMVKTLPLQINALPASEAKK